MPTNQQNDLLRLITPVRRGQSESAGDRSNCGVLARKRFLGLVRHFGPLTTGDSTGSDHELAAEFDATVQRMARYLRIGKQVAHDDLPACRGGGRKKPSWYDYVRRELIRRKNAAPNPNYGAITNQLAKLHADGNTKQVRYHTYDLRWPERTPVQKHSVSGQPRG